jgi:hypothetical protein
MTVRSKTRKVIPVALLFLLPAVLPAATEEETPLCDVMANLAGLNGKEVAVRGTWGSGGHGEWLSATGCKYSLTTESRTWRNQIALVEEKSASKIDFESLAALAIRMESLKGNRQEYDIIVTYIGVLETRVPLQVAHYPNGEVAPAGFGPLGVFPAQLHYRAVRHVVIQKHAGPVMVNAAPDSSRAVRERRN